MMWVNDLLCIQAGWIEEGILQTDARRGCAGYCSYEAEYCLKWGIVGFARSETS